MKIFAVLLSCLAAFVVAAPFPIGTGTAPSYPMGSGMPPMPTGSGWFPGRFNGTHPPCPAGSGMPMPMPMGTGTALVYPPGGTAPIKRAAQFGGMSTIPSLSFSLPTGGYGSGFAAPTGLGAGSFASISLRTTGLGSDIAAPSGYPNFASFDTVRKAGPTGHLPSISFPPGMPAPTGALPSMPWSWPSIVATPTGHASFPSITMPSVAAPTGLEQGRGYAGFMSARR